MGQGTWSTKMVKRRDGEAVKGRSGEITHHGLRITLHALRITHHALRITNYALRLGGDRK